MSGYSVQSIGQWNSWTPTHTGFSVDPTVAPVYSVNGSMCTIIYQPSSNGTSNAAGLTLTLPFAAHSSMSNVAIVVRIVDNGTSAAGRFVFASESNIATIHPSLTSTTWTASGTKAVSFSITYRIA